MSQDQSDQLIRVNSSSARVDWNERESPALAQQDVLFLLSLLHLVNVAVLPIALAQFDGPTSHVLAC